MHFMWMLHDPSCECSQQIRDHRIDDGSRVQPSRCVDFVGEPPGDQGIGIDLNVPIQVRGDLNYTALHVAV